MNADPIPADTLGSQRHSLWAKWGEAPYVKNALYVEKYFLELQNLMLPLRGVIGH